jgi:hypothetical protein
MELGKLLDLVFWVSVIVLLTIAVVMMILIVRGKLSIP